MIDGSQLLEYACRGGIVKMWVKDEGWAELVESGMRVNALAVEAGGDPRIEYDTVLGGKVCIYRAGRDREPRTVVNTVRHLRGDQRDIDTERTFDWMADGMERAEQG
jgi:hypothetical protein